MKVNVAVGIELSIEVESEGDSWAQAENEIRRDFEADSHKYFDLLREEFDAATPDDVEIWGATIIEDDWS